MESYDQLVIRSIESELRGVYSEFVTSVETNPYLVGSASVGSGALAVALLLAATPATVSIAGLATAMGIAAGVGSIGIGIAQLALAFTEERNNLFKMKKDVDAALAISGSPIVLTAAAFSAAMGDKQTVMRSIEVAKLVDSVLTLRSGLKSIAQGDDNGAIDVAQAAIGLKDIDYQEVQQFAARTIVTKPKQDDRASSSREAILKSSIADSTGTVGDDARIRDAARAQAAQRATARKALQDRIEAVRLQAAIEEERQRRERERLDREKREQQEREKEANLRAEAKRKDDLRKAEEERKRKEAEEAEARRLAEERRKQEEEQRAREAAARLEQARREEEARARAYYDAQARSQDQMRGAGGGGGIIVSAGPTNNPSNLGENRLP